MTDDRLHVLCNGFPGSVLEFPWDQPTWKVGGKMFCGRSGIGSRVMLKATVDQQSMLIQHPGIEPAMYLGRYGWIEAEMSIEDELLEELIQESYRQVVAALPKSKRPT